MSGHQNQLELNFAVSYGLPLVLPVGFRALDADGGLVVVVRCPFCGERHEHPWPKGMESVGPRSASCGGGPYVVRTPGTRASA